MLPLISAMLNTAPELSPQTTLADYVVAENGLFIRSSNRIMAACVPVAVNTHAPNSGLLPLEPHLHLNVPKVPDVILHSIYAYAYDQLPNEVMFQLVHQESWAQDDGWRIVLPLQAASPSNVIFYDVGDAAIDLHSHGNLFAFYSDTDDADEQGFRLYCVIGEIATNPHIICRVGIYGHTYPVHPTAIFTGLGPFKALDAVEDTL